VTSNLPEEQHDFVAPLKFEITRAAWDAVIPVITRRVRALEGTVADYHAVIALLETHALTVISDTITAEINVRRAELEALSADAAALTDEIAFIRAGGIDGGRVTLSNIVDLAATNVQDAIAELLAEIQAAKNEFANLKPIQFEGVSVDTDLVAGKPYRLLEHTIKVTLPGNPEFGDSIRILDGEVLSPDTMVTLAHNGNPLMGLLEDMNLNIAGLDVIVWWNGTDWRLF